MRLAHWLTSLALFTASCDLILTINLGGQVRFAQFMILGVILIGTGQILHSRAILWPRGGHAFALWCFLQGVLITQSLNPLLSTQPFALMLFTAVGILAVLQCYGHSKNVGDLMKVYLVSFVVVAGFGAVQFVCPALHLGYPLIAQVITLTLPRINGFSYEPSYFATYMILGWIMLIDLHVTKARITQSRRWTYCLWLVSVILFLSTSKTAWLLMIGEGLARFLPRVFDLLRRQLREIFAGRSIIPVPRMRVVLIGVLTAAGSFTFLFVVGQFIDLNRFLQGSGLNGTASHSLNDRLVGFALTVKLIGQHFWIGRSLGGVNEGIAVLAGHPVQTFAELHQAWGFPVPLDVFAASGFWGFIPFLWFFVAITWGERNLIREHWNDERAKWLHALIRALIFEWLALLADQNLLRVYFWFHVTMVVVVGYNLRYSRAGQLPAESLVTA